MISITAVPRERERDMRHRLIVEIVLDKEPESSTEVQALLDDIAENYGRPRLGFIPRTGPAFVRSVRLVTESETLR